MKTKSPIVLSGIMLAALGVIGMLGPFGTDTYLPALPAIADEFQVPGAQVQIAIAAFTIGEAMGQFVLGALSDRFGRKLIIVSGGILMTTAAALASWAPSIEALIVLCLTMGFTVAGGIVGGRAVVADLTSGPESARPFAILGMLISTGPILGPVFGTVLLEFGGWRAIFTGLAIFAALSTLAVVLLVPESLPPEKRHQGGLISSLKTFGKVLRNRRFLSYGAILWFGFGLMFAYIASSSFIIQNILGLSPAINAASFAINGVVLVTASLITARLSGARRNKNLIVFGVSIQVVAIVLLAIIVAAHIYNPVLVLFNLLLFPTSMGFIFGPATALAMTEVRFAAGSAAALIGSVQFLAAAIATIFLGIVSGNALLGLLIVGGSMEFFVLLSLWVAIRRDKKQDFSSIQ